jgi:uncharacterized membrane protein
MVEEVKQEQAKPETSKVFSVVLKTVLGLGFLVLGVLSIVRWWMHLKVVILGCLGLFLLLAGIITLAIARE